MIALAKPAKFKKAPKAKKPTGYILYEGPSLLDGSPIVVIALVRSSNRKTGNMVQTYILRSDMSPVEAIRSGADFSICGNCKHRGDGKRGRTCYVNIGQGPLMVYKSYLKGNYPKRSPIHPEIQSLLSGRIVRLGTYGDPAALSAMFWQAVLRPAAAWTGYSHQWATRPDLQGFLMASCDNVSEYQLAVSAGWRTFRVRSEDMPVMSNEIDCPASEQAGKRTICERCRLCQGTAKKAKNVSIPIHGGRAVMSNAQKLLPILQGLSN